jgi:hypothetical protein
MPFLPLSFFLFSLTDSSDFIAMNGVPVVRFTELNSSRYKNFLLDENPETIGHYKVRVFRRAVTSTICGLTESQFVEWCILSGNDFTSSFQLTDFDAFGNQEQKPSGKKDYSHSPMKAKDRSADAKRMIKSQAEDFRLFSSTNSKLNMAIEYSRDFYELRDLSKYPIDPPDDEPQLVSLSFGDHAAISHWIESHRHGFDVTKLQNIGRVAWTIFKDLSDSSQNDDFTAENLIENITPVYMKTLERMLLLIKTSPLCRPQHLNTQIKHPNWRDLMFTHYYQLVCKHLLKSVRKTARHDSEIVMGFHIFNAELFHSLLEEENLKAAMGGLSIAPSTNSTTESAKKSLPQKEQKDSQQIQKTTPKAKKMNSTPQKESQPLEATTQKTDVTPQNKNSESKASNSKTKKKPAADRSQPEPDGDSKEDKITNSETLPIDAHRNEILHRIQRDRVTIIQGETGCGKSSRIPVMLLEDAQRRGVRCRMMVSQPRRIAATTLMKRVRSTLGMQVRVTPPYPYL